MTRYNREPVRSLLIIGRVIETVLDLAYLFVFVWVTHISVNLVGSESIYMARIMVCIHVH